MTVPTLRPPRNGPVQVQQRTVASWVWKLMVALTGIIWALFILIHLFGNLKIYAGADAYNHYAHWLREVGYPFIPKSGVLWVMRMLLGLTLLIHMIATLTIYIRGRRARGRVRAQPRCSTSRFMVPTGILIAIFVVVHLLDLTIGRVVASDTFNRSTPYENVFSSLSRPWMGIFYLLVMMALAGHLLHGVIAAFADLGTTTAKYRTISVGLAHIVAVVVVVGNAFIPVAIMTGLIS